MLYRLQIFILCLITTTVWSQNNVNQLDSLYNSDYIQLFEKFRVLRNDTLKYKNYTEAYLIKAKLNNDIIKQSNGYILQALISQEFKALRYADSVIELTKEVKDFNYPARAHILKARNLGRKELYAEALEELVKANKYSVSNNNVSQKNKINYFIGVLKQSLGEYEEALVRYKSAEKHYRSQYLKNDTNKYDFLKSLYAVSNAYNFLKKHDSAFSAVEEGIKLSLKSTDSVFYGYFLLSSGITMHYKTQYKESIDSLNKFKTLYRNRIKDGNMKIADLYLGKSYYKLDDINAAIEHLEKVDSITPLMIRGSYESLIKLYKTKGNVEKQVEYIDKILKIDSVINSDSRHLYKNIEKEYSTPNLILEKEEIINSLKWKGQKNRIWILVLLLSLVSLTLVLVYNYQRKLVYKKRFISLYNTNKHNTSEEISSQKTKIKSINISENIIKEILNKLDLFEENKQFTDSGVTISELSKKFNTNTRYLSKVINQYKNKTFSN